MSMWYYCHVHFLQFHEDNDGEYGGTCPMCNMEMQIAELKVVLTGLMSRDWVQDQEDFEPLRDRVLAVLATIPGRRLEVDVDAETLVSHLKHQARELWRILESKAPSPVDEEPP